MLSAHDHEQEEGSMQAIVQERYGGPEVLVRREMGRPGIGDGDVLVRVRAAGRKVVVTWPR
jgi:NADPH:quinone reductase-like Zn-dependent oxidoreductase